MCLYGLLLTDLNTILNLQTFKRIEASIKYFGLSSLFTGVFLISALFGTVLFSHTSLTRMQQNIGELVDILCEQYFCSFMLFLVSLFYFVFFKLAVFPNQK
jgi:NADH:ubiquinone oxidoreductase subunit 2 (subunit N)